MNQKTISILVLLCTAGLIIFCTYRWNKGIVAALGSIKAQDNNSPQNNLTQQIQQVGGKPSFPYNVNKKGFFCETLFTDYGAKPYIGPQYLEHQAAHHKFFMDACAKEGVKAEGFSSESQTEMLSFRAVAQLPWIHTICETGFNGGHSSLNWLTSKKTNKVYSFDLGFHKYAHLVGGYMNKTFPGRHVLTFGDSTKTLPEFHKKHPNLKCDLILVDGGHTFPVATADIANFLPMANKKNIVMFDDYPTHWGGGFGAAWENAVKKGTIKQLFQCTIQKLPPTNPLQRGFSIGEYVVP